MCQERFDLSVRARGLEFGQPHLRDLVGSSNADDILNLQLEVIVAVGRTVPMKGNKVHFAVAPTVGEEL